MERIKSKEKSKAGGKRVGAGRKPKYCESTQFVGFKCPTSKIEEFKIYCSEKLSEWCLK
jgi:hypothetical protein